MQQHHDDHHQEAKMHILTISGSLHPRSRSHVLARFFIDRVRDKGIDCELLDLREHDLPLHTGTAACKTDAVLQLVEKVRRADAIVVATPVYVYNTNAAVKNFVDLSGRAWTDKPVSFLCSAGGNSSYMAIMSLANSLMLDFRCLIVPRFVYAISDDFADDRGPDMHIASGEIKERIEQLVEALTKLTRALQ